MAKITRGAAAPGRQLGKLQRRILIWVYNYMIELYAFQRCASKSWLHEIEGREERLKVLSQKGTPWSAKIFYGHAPTRSEEATLSGSLVSLEVKGLVVLHDSTNGLGDKPRTTHVKLTQLGRESADLLTRNGGKSQRELEEERRQAMPFLRHIRDIKGDLKEAKARVEWLKKDSKRFRLLVDPKKSPELEKYELEEATREVEILEDALGVWEGFMTDPSEAAFMVRLAAASERSQNRYEVPDVMLGDMP